MERILADEVAKLDGDARTIYDRYRGELAHVSCFRSTECGIEQVYVVARRGNHVLFFDDVEDDFGTAILDDKGQFQFTGSWGPLPVALKAFRDEEAKSDNYIHPSSTNEK